MTIKCHFDGKVFVPDEPVDLPAGRAAEALVGEPGVVFTDGPGGTVGDLLASDFIGAWADRDDMVDALEFAREMRRRAEQREDAPDAGR